MKKLYAAFCMLCAMMPHIVMADMWDLEGQITAVNENDHIITLQSMRGTTTIQVLPYTELKGDDCGVWGNDIYGTFKDLTVGKFVEVEAYPNTAGTNQQNPSVSPDAQMVAKEIEWKCGRKAY